MTRTPAVSVDILVIREHTLLLGLMTPRWNYEGRQVYGVPGRDIRFGENMGDTVRRNIHEEFACRVTGHRVICVNANYALGNHYIGIGVVAEIDGEPSVRLPDDWVRWEWFDVADIPENLFPATKNLIDCYLEGKVNTQE